MHADTIDAVRRTLKYETPQNVRSGADLLFGRFDSWLYVRIFRVVISAYTHVLRNAYDDVAWAAHGFGMLRAAEACGAKCTVTGLEHVASLRGPAVFVANHMSMLDTFILPPFILTFRPVSMVVKTSLLRYPMFGPVLARTQPISLRRENPREDLEIVLREGARLLAAGRSLCLFPQSTRSAMFSPRDFNSLGAKIASRAGVPIVPVALQTDFQQIGRLVKDIGHLDRSKPVRIEFGSPVEAAGNGRDAHNRVLAFILERLRAWNVSILEEPV